MSYDRVSLFSGGNSSHSSGGKGGSLGLSDLASGGASLGTASAVSRALQYSPSPLMRKWGDNFTTWSTRTALADMADNTIFRRKTIENIGSGPGLSTSLWSYNSLFRLGDESVQLKNFSVRGFKEAVSHNVAPLRTALAEGQGVIRNGTTVGGWLKNTVIGENIKPIKDLFRGEAGAKVGSALGRMVGFGFIAQGVLSEGKAAYEQAKAEEDGSFGSKVATVAKTGFAMAKKFVKSAISWEAGGIGFAIGKALLPIALGGLPVGGILIGALVGAVAHLALEKISPSIKPPDEGKADEHADDTALASHAEEERTSNPFAAATV